MSSNRPNQVSQDSNELEAEKIENVRFVHDDHQDVPAVSSFDMLRSNFASTTTFYSFPRKFTEKKDEPRIESFPKITPDNHL